MRVQPEPFSLLRVIGDALEIRILRRAPVAGRLEMRPYGLNRSRYIRMADH